MMIRHPDDVTRAVLSEIERAPDARWREIMSAAVRHLHGFAREANLTESEFQETCAVIAKLGQLTNESHNEVVLAAGSLGLSSLVCLINNGDRGRTETTANLLGPFWRAGAPATANGASIVCARRRPAIRCSSRRRYATGTGVRSPAPRSTSGTRRARASTRTRTPGRRT
jgi:hydroxyquinol 1,2-dioxygenase